MSLFYNTDSKRLSTFASIIKKVISLSYAVISDYKARSCAIALHPSLLDIAG